MVTQLNEFSTIGAWLPGDRAPAFDEQELAMAAPDVREPVHIIRQVGTGRIGVGKGGRVHMGSASPDAASPSAPSPSAVSSGPASAGAGAYRLLATLAPIYPEWLGDRSFCEVHGTRFAYVAGEMANGIATTALVIAMAKAKMLGFFGAAGLKPEVVEGALDELERTLGDRHAWGVNLIHAPYEAELEDRIADLLIRRRVTRVCGSAFMELTPPMVRYAATGLRTAPDGRILRANHVFAKLSRPEVARRFMSPAPADILQVLVQRGQLTEEEARLAQHVPVAEDITVEADSGGHTDNQALTALFPTILSLRTQLAERYGYTRPMRVGAAGGMGTPSAVAAAFALGASYVLTGSINQAALESGLSLSGKRLLCQAELGDVTMAPAADMFELGVKVQVLKRGTVFASRGRKLYEAYTGYPSLEQIPDNTRARIEKEILQASFEDVWNETRQFWQRRDPTQVARAERDPKHRMALVFRWYLGKSSRWAIDGEPSRRADYQIWCGPAMGAFNAWVKGSFLETVENRTVTQIALNLLEGAAVITRAQQLRASGVPLPAAAFEVRPRPLA